MRASSRWKTDAMQLPPEILKRSWFLAGPTACGKSATALVLARQLDAEIISLDSMAIYRGMDIGTAKPTLEERQRIPHHLIDIADPHEDFSVAEFLQLAAAAATDIAARGRTPLFVGGTGLYLRSMLRGLCEAPAADWDLRRSLEQHARELGPEWLHAELARRDPVTAARLHLNDMRRIIRAIEVFELTGSPISADQTQQPKPLDQRPASVVWISPPREWLRDRISQRVDQMLTAGWLDETRTLMQRTPPLGRTASQALGYRELIEHLEGRISLDDAAAAIKTATHQFAKRQHTWFRNLEECRELPIRGEESAEEIAARVIQPLESSSETSAGI